MVSFEELKDEFVRNMAAQFQAQQQQQAYGASQGWGNPFGSGPHFDVLKDIHIYDTVSYADVTEPAPARTDIDSLETIDKYNIRRAKEIEIENEQGRRDKRANLFHDRRKEALKAFKEWNGAMSSGVNVKPLCALCDKTVDYLVCRPVFYRRNRLEWFLSNQLAFKSITYTAYCHGEQQNFTVDPRGEKNWQGFALTTAFNFKGDK